MATILIADDHHLVRDTISAYLETVDDFSVVATSDIAQALDVMRNETRIDLAILDYSMPGMNGLEGLARVQRRHPNIKVALMSGVAKREVAGRAIAQGAIGFLPKSLTASSMVNAIRFMLAGEVFLPAEFSGPAKATERPVPFNTLSTREMQTLEQLCGGQTNKEIARRLDIKEVTVKLHVKNVLTKLGVTNRTQAALMAREAQVF